MDALHAVTGAFGYSGKYIARRLLERGDEVITLTNSPRRANSFGERVKAFPFNFDEPKVLARSLRGVRVLCNTYWVRFNHRLFKHADAVRNTERLFGAARAARVERVVHVSITNPSADSPLEYFSGKARLEAALAESGISFAIVRPTVLFGREEIKELMADLLCVEAPAAGPTRLTRWIEDHADSLGRRYTSELARRRCRTEAYRSN